jgi:predicted SAM-dependent methyltransferase
MQKALKEVQALKLDIGCGGNKKQGFLGVDINPGENVDFVMDVCKLEFEDNSVEEIFSRRCIQHVKGDKKALNEIFRVLKPDCIFTLQVASWYGWLYYRLHLSTSYGNYKTFHLYRDSKIKKLLKEAGFTIQSLHHIPSPRGIGYDIEVVCRKEATNETPAGKAGAR